MTTENTRYDYDNQNYRFGGIIYLSDFDTNHIGSRNMASRIEADLKFDLHCKKNEIARNNRKNKGDDFDE